MKHLAWIFMVLLMNNAMANGSCFATAEIKALIKASEALDKCFAHDENGCGLHELNIEEQQSVNSDRLIPFDRGSDDGFMDTAIGLVTSKFLQKPFKAGTAQKISRCHVITSAHIVYGDGSVPVNSNNFDLSFYTGQTCNPNGPFKNRSGASVFFKMVDEAKRDFFCQLMDRHGNCELRH